MTARIVCSCTTENLGIAFRLNVDPACPVHRNAQDVQVTAQTLQLALLSLGQLGPMPERDMPEMPWTGPARPAEPEPDRSEDYGTDCGTSPCAGPANASLSDCWPEALFCRISVNEMCPFHH